jgi:hypothetical protein
VAEDLDTVCFETIYATLFDYCALPLVLFNSR